MTGDDSNHPNRRQLLGTLGTSALAMGVSGCAGGDDDTSDDGSGDDTTTDTTTQSSPDTATETTTTSDETTAETTTTQGAADIEPMCKVENEIDELSVTACQSEIQDDQLVISVTIRNDGEQVADLFSCCSMTVSIYDTDEPTSDSRVPSSANNKYPSDEIAPDETREFTITVIAYEDDRSITEIKSYKIDQFCSTPDSGVYCD